ncbi:hypothetical protein BJY00DRAFT_280266, partial [Aspergillus carlsbadensis]
MFFCWIFFLHFSGSWVALALLRLARGCSKGSKDSFSGNCRCLKRGFLIGACLVTLQGFGSRDGMATGHWQLLLQRQSPG